MAFCKSCGAALKPEARFCHACGEPAAQTLQPVMPEPPISSSAQSRQGMGMAGIAAVAAVLIGGGVLVWQSGVLSRLGGATGAPDPSVTGLADIAECVGPYKAALMMEQDGGNLTEADLERRAQADCAAMTPEQRAIYGQGAPPGIATQDGADTSRELLARLDLTTITYPFSGASCVYSAAMDMKDIVGGNDYGEEAIRFGIDGSTVKFEPIGEWSGDAETFGSNGPAPITLTIESISDVGKSEEEYGYPASQFLVDVTVNQGGNAKVHRLYRFCGDG
jgi:hypothetical protein